MESSRTHRTGRFDSDGVAEHLVERGGGSFFFFIVLLLLFIPFALVVAGLHVGMFSVFAQPRFFPPALRVFLEQPPQIPAKEKAAHTHTLTHSRSHIKKQFDTQSCFSVTVQMGFGVLQSGIRQQESAFCQFRSPRLCSHTLISNRDGLTVLNRLKSRLLGKKKTCS